MHRSTELVSQKKKTLQFPLKFSTVFKRHPHSLFSSLTGIAPITVITRCDQLNGEEEKNKAWEDAYEATNSSPSHTFLTWNYTKDNIERNPEIERMTFDILHYALITAERAVKQMKNRERNKREDDMMRALKCFTFSGQVAPDSVDGNMTFQFSLASPFRHQRQDFVKNPIFSICSVSPCLELKSANCGQRYVDFDSLFLK